MDKVIDLMVSLLKVDMELMALMKDELDELAPLASIHGWKSSRYEAGKKLRERIELIQAKIDVELNK